MKRPNEVDTLDRVLCDIFETALQFDLLLCFSFKFDSINTQRVQSSDELL